MSVSKVGGNFFAAEFVENAPPFRSQPDVANSLRIEGSRLEVLPAFPKSGISYITLLADQPRSRFRVRVDGTPGYWFYLGVCKEDANLRNYDDGTTIISGSYAGHSASFRGNPYGN